MASNECFDKTMEFRLETNELCEQTRIFEFRNDDKQKMKDLHRLIRNYTWGIIVKREIRSGFSRI